MLNLKIAYRNLFRQKRRTIFTASSMIVGFVLACFFIGWSDGSYGTMIDNFTRYQTGHIQIHKGDYLDDPKMYKTIDDYENISTDLENIDEIVSFAGRIKTGGLISFGEESAAAQITGIEPTRENETISFAKKIVKGDYFSNDPDSYECLIGKGLARILQADIGDEVVLVSQGADGSIANELYKIRGLLNVGSDMENRMAFYIKLQQAQEVFVLYNRVHEIAINTTDVSKAEKVRDIIIKRIDNSELNIQSWKGFAKDFYRAMKADEQGMWISLLIVILVVSIGVLNTVLMSVLERRREYGVLKAMGTKPRSIIKLILYENTILAFVSIFVGAIIGTIINWILSVYGLTFDEPFSYGGIMFDKMFATINFRTYWIPAVTVVLSTIIVCIIPALKAAKTKPAEAMRTF